MLEEISITEPIS